MANSLRFVSSSMVELEVATPQEVSTSDALLDELLLTPASRRYGVLSELLLEVEIDGILVRVLAAISTGSTRMICGRLLPAQFVDVPRGPNHGMMRRFALMFASSDTQAQTTPLIAGIMNLRTMKESGDDIVALASKTQHAPWSD